MVRFLRIIGIILFFGLIVAAGLFWMGHGTGPLPPATVDFARLAPGERDQLIARGEKVMRAGNCIGCHLDPEGGSHLGGGYPMETPLGTIYGTNISPSSQHGIGQWSSDDFYRAVAWGVAPGNRNLYPAMPYVSYHEITREDSDALFAWLMAQPAVEKPNLAHDLMFPFNLRIGLTFWNALFRPDAQPYAPLAGAEEYAVDGHYMVNVLGHCGECHTPRNIAYAMTSDHLAGFVMEGAYARDLRAASLFARGWTEGDLQSYLFRGISPQGVTTLTMEPVMRHSTSHMSAAELSAISSYLLQSGAGDRPTPLAQAAEPDPEGHIIYQGLCAGCHGADGEGQPHSSVRLDINTVAMAGDPLNLVRIINEGIEERDLAHGERMQKMPGYREWLSDEQMAALTNYMRQRWGGHADALSAEDIADARERYEPYLDGGE